MENSINNQVSNEEKAGFLAFLALGGGRAIVQIADFEISPELSFEHGAKVLDKFEKKNVSLFIQSPDGGIKDFIAFSNDAFSNRSSYNYFLGKVAQSFGLNVSSPDLSTCYEALKGKILSEHPFEGFGKFPNDGARPTYAPGRCKNVDIVKIYNEKADKSVPLDDSLNGAQPSPAGEGISLYLTKSLIYAHNMDAAIRNRGGELKEIFGNNNLPDMVGEMSNQIIEEAMMRRKANQTNIDKFAPSPELRANLAEGPSV